MRAAIAIAFACISLSPCAVLPVCAEDGQSAPAYSDRPLAGSRDRDLHPGAIFLAPAGLNSTGALVPARPPSVPPVIQRRPAASKNALSRAASPATNAPGRKQAAAVTASAKLKGRRPGKQVPRSPAAENGLNASGQDSEYVTASATWPVDTPDGNVIKAWLDRPGSMPVYRVGEKLKVNVTALADCNVLVFNHAPDGVLTQIYPNDFDKSSTLAAGTTISIGGDGSSFEYEIFGEGGIERIFVYAYPANVGKSPLTVAMASLPNTPFRSTSMSLAEYRKLVAGAQGFHARGLKVVQKSGAQPVSYLPDQAAANKIELTFKVVKR